MIERRERYKRQIPRNPAEMNSDNQKKDPASCPRCKHRARTGTATLRNPAVHGNTYVSLVIVPGTWHTC